MNIYINKDVDETLDYVFIRDVPDDISSVNFEQEAGATLSIDSCTVNLVDISDFDGNEYSARRAIIMWVSGGVAGNVEKVRVYYTTAGGRQLDFNLTFNLVAEDC